MFVAPDTKMKADIKGGVAIYAQYMSKEKAIAKVRSTLGITKHRLIDEMVKAGEI